MINKIKKYIFYWIVKRSDFCQTCLLNKRQECCFDFLFEKSNRQTRRKWWKMVTKPKSKSYLGKVVIKDGQNLHGFIRGESYKIQGGGQTGQKDS